MIGAANGLPTKVSSKERTDWHADATCCARRAGLSRFFPPSSKRGHWRAYCERCPVIDVCFWTAMVTEFESGYHNGIWGGTTAAQRRHIAGVVGTSIPTIRLEEVLATWERAFEDKVDKSPVPSDAAGQ
jgi:hypothetical protein